MKVLDDPKNVAKLTRLLRMATMSMAPMRTKTPTAGLGVILNLCPLHLQIKMLAAKAYYRVVSHKRTQWDGEGKLGKGHLKRWAEYAELHEIQQLEGDQLPQVFNWDKQYTVDQKSMNGEGKPLEKGEEPLQCFTDGSKMLGAVGYGFCIAEDGKFQPPTAERMCDTATVFQAELKAIEQGSDKMADSACTEAVIYSDSQAALLALANPTITSAAVLQCAQHLNDLGSNKTVTLKWVKAHKGHEGNERADKAAKKGTEQQGRPVDQEPTAVCKSINNALIEDHMWKQWDQEWLGTEKYRQTKHWYPEPKRPAYFLEETINLDRTTLGLYIQFTTGHNFMLRHQHIIDQMTDPSCRLCGMAPESSWHIFAECIGTQGPRMEVWGKLKFDQPIVKWRPSEIVKFIKSPIVRWLMDPNAALLPPPGHMADGVGSNTQRRTTANIRIPPGQTWTRTQRRILELQGDIQSPPEAPNPNQEHNQSNHQN
jgi:ribonuclease HI